VEYLKTIGIVNNGLNGRGFANPYDLAVSGDGRIFVLNRCDPARATGIRIGVCNLDEDYLFEFGDGAGSGDTQFRWPVAMAFDSQEHLYVTDEQNQRVTVFDSDGQFLRKWGTPGRGDGEFNGPAGVAAGPGPSCESHGPVYVVDQHNARVQKFTSDGVYVGQWGSFGSGPGQFNLPWGAATDATGNVYVADWRNDRIQKFSADGALLDAFGRPGKGYAEFNRPVGLAVDHQGNIIVADWGNERVQVLDREGRFVASFRGESRDSLWAQDYFSANPDEANARRTAHLEPEIERRPEYENHRGYEWERSANVEKLFWGPTSIKLGPDGLVYVVDSLRHRIQIYRQAG
jgi:DNA-binding beta-propeller fold protein YncE